MVAAIVPSSPLSEFRSTLESSQSLRVAPGIPADSAISGLAKVELFESVARYLGADVLFCLFLLLGGVFWSGWNALRGALEAVGGPWLQGAYPSRDLDWFLPVNHPVNIEPQTPASAPRPLSYRDHWVRTCSSDLPDGVSSGWGQRFLSGRPAELLDDQRHDLRLYGVGLNVGRAKEGF